MLVLHLREPESYTKRWGEGEGKNFIICFPLTFKATHQSGLLYGGDENSLLKFPP
jgi:hypothetical protein